MRYVSVVPHKAAAASVSASLKNIISQLVPPQPKNVLFSATASLHLWDAAEASGPV